MEPNANPREFFNTKMFRMIFSGAKKSGSRFDGDSSWWLELDSLVCLVEVKVALFIFFRDFLVVNPIPSVYGIFTYIWLIFMVNAGKYTIHGC